MKKRRIIVNNDYGNIFQARPPITTRDILDAVDKMLPPAAPGSQVDALFLMIDADFSGSVIGPELTRLYDHPMVDPCIESLQKMKAEGKDPWGMVLARAKEKGLDFFASVRMNDTHYKDGVFHPWVDQFYYDNLHNRVSQSGAMDGSRNLTEFDYRKSAVREHCLAMIRGVVENYDVDGVELDMTRNCRFFPGENREECAPVMTEFVRQVREVLDAAAAKRTPGSPGSPGTPGTPGKGGKPRSPAQRIELAVTIPCSLYRARLEGLDVPAWVRLGYIDLLCLSTPFEVDTERDVADTVLKVPGVAVYAGCDRNFQYPGRPFPKEAYRAMACNYLRQGATGTYIYNVMHWTMRLENPTEAMQVHGGGSLEVHDASLMSEVGELKTLEGLDKLYLVSHGPATPDKPNATLPVTVPALGEVTIRVSIGDDIAAAAKAGTIERIWVQAVSPDCADYNNYTLKLNGIDLARQYAYTPYATKPPHRLIFPEPENKMPPTPVENVRRHPARAIDLHMGVNYVTIKSWKAAMTVSDVEIAIVYKKK